MRETKTMKPLVQNISSDLSLWCDDECTETHLDAHTCLYVFSSKDVVWRWKCMSQQNGCTDESPCELKEVCGDSFCHLPDNLTILFTGWVMEGFFFTWNSSHHQGAETSVWVGPVWNSCNWRLSSTRPATLMSVSDHIMTWISGKSMKLKLNVGIIVSINNILRFGQSTHVLAS